MLILNLEKFKDSVTVLFDYTSYMYKVTLYSMYGMIIEKASYWFLSILRRHHAVSILYKDSFRE